MVLGDNSETGKLREETGNRGESKQDHPEEVDCVIWGGGFVRHVGDLPSFWGRLDICRVSKFEACWAYLSN